MKKISFSNIMNYFGVFIAIMFILLGIYVLLTNSYEYIPWNYRLIFGILTLSYGGFRLVNLYFKSRSERSNIENEG